MNERFWVKVEKKGPGDCWIWTASGNGNGYGIFWVDKHKGKQRAHRVSWEIANGPIPEGMKVLHTCDNRGCVNPRHLFLGTQKDNLEDCSRKGRSGRPTIRGEKCCLSKLLPEQVLKIRRDTRSLRTIASEYGVDHTSILAIKSGKSWGHLK